MFPTLKIIVLSASQGFTTARNELECSVQGFVRKNSDLKNVLIALQEVRAGNKYMDSATAQDTPKHMLTLGRNLRSSALTQIRLSVTEIENIHLLKCGLSFTEIANLTKRSVKTVSTQKQALMKKLGSKNNKQ